uniref:Beta-defensin n=1 Tax=Capra hircus TaxID=9925 RepID=A0A452FHB8_CAPHI
VYLLNLYVASILIIFQLIFDYLKCWNYHGKCRQKCFKKEKVYVYCTNNKLCCVKSRYLPKNLPWQI